MSPLMIVSRPRPCRNCGKTIRMVLIPSLGPNQHIYEDFDPATEQVVVQHDCPNWDGDSIPFSQITDDDSELLKQETS